MGARDEQLRAWYLSTRVRDLLTPDERANVNQGKYVMQYDNSDELNCTRVEEGTDIHKIDGDIPKEFDSLSACQTTLRLLIEKQSKAQQDEILEILRAVADGTKDTREIVQGVRNLDRVLQNTFDAVQNLPQTMQDAVADKMSATKKSKVSDMLKIIGIVSFAIFIVGMFSFAYFEIQRLRYHELEMEAANTRLQEENAQMRRHIDTLSEGLMNLRFNFQTIINGLRWILPREKEAALESLKEAFMTIDSYIHMSPYTSPWILFK